MPASGNRLWYPADLVDEFLPDGRRTPEAWLEFLHISPEDMEDEDEFLANHYEPGDEIAFKWCERRGIATILINADGRLTGSYRCTETVDLFSGVADGPAPNVIGRDINSFWHYETEIFAETLEDFVAQIHETNQFLDPSDYPMEIVADIAVWSEKITFIINADGKSLTRVTPEEAKP